MPKGVHEQHYERLSRREYGKTWTHCIPNDVNRKNMESRSDYRKHMESFYPKENTGKTCNTSIAKREQENMESSYPEGNTGNIWNLSFPKGVQNRIEREGDRKNIESFDPEREYRIIISQREYKTQLFNSFIPKRVQATHGTLLYHREYRQTPYITINYITGVF